MSISYLFDLHDALQVDDASILVTTERYNDQPDLYSKKPVTTTYVNHWFHYAHGFPAARCSIHYPDEYTEQPQLEITMGMGSPHREGLKKWAKYHNLPYKEF